MTTCLNCRSEIRPETKRTSERINLLTVETHIRDVCPECDYVLAKTTKKVSVKNYVNGEVF